MWKSEKLFAALVREHEPGLTAFVRSCVPDPGAVDDIVQDSFIVAWRRLAEFDDTRPFAAWVRGIAKNKILEHLRNHTPDGQHILPLTSDLIERIAEEHGRLTAQAGDTLLDRLQPLADCLGTLQADDRSIVERHYRDDQSCRYIGEQIGLNLEVIKKRLQRAREKLHDCILAKLGIEASDG